MKVLVHKGGLDAYFADFKPIAKDWLLWELSTTRAYRIIHERCLHKIVTQRMADLTSQEHFTRDDVCASCGKEAPEEVKHFIFIANGVASYGALNDY